MTPRQTVQSYLVTSLQTILKVNQYHTDVETVEQRLRLSRDIPDTECPAIIIESGQDVEERPETLGGNVGNEYFRNWECTLYLILRNPGDGTIDDAGEDFLADVVCCLIANRSNLMSGKAGKPLPRDIRFPLIDAKGFTQMENGTAEFKLPIHVYYDFTIGDLRL